MLYTGGINYSIGTNWDQRVLPYSATCGIPVAVFSQYILILLIIYSDLFIWKILKQQKNLQLLKKNLSVLRFSI